jgi:hypothetical protein
MGIMGLGAALVFMKYGFLIRDGCKDSRRTRTFWLGPNPAQIPTAATLLLIMFFPPFAGSLSIKDSGNFSFKGNSSEKSRHLELPADSAFLQVTRGGTLNCA